MKINKVDHIGIVVRNIEESLAKWVDLFDAEAGEIEEIEERGVRLVSLEFEKGPSVELVSPLGEDSPVSKFLRERGEGIHHVSLKVKDIDKVMERLKAKGVEFVQDKPVRGAKGSRIAFLHPRSLNGVLLELKEQKE